MVQVEPFNHLAFQMSQLGLRSPSISSPRGIPESNGRAVISALRSLQGKIKSMERERSQSNVSSTVTTPRLPAGELPIMKRFIARSRSLSTDATSAASLSEKTENSDQKKSENQSKGELLTC